MWEKSDIIPGVGRCMSGIVRVPSGNQNRVSRNKGFVVGMSETVWDGPPQRGN